MKIKTLLWWIIAGIVIVLAIFVALYGAKTVFFAMVEFGGVLSFFVIIAIGIFFLFYTGDKRL